MTEGVGHATRTEDERGAGGAEAAQDRGADSSGQEFSVGVQGGGDLRAELRDECLRQEIFYSLKVCNRNHPLPHLGHAVVLAFAQFSNCRCLRLRRRDLAPCEPRFERGPEPRGVAGHPRS